MIFYACTHFTELISNTGVLLQSEMLLFLEDSTWAVHASVMTVLTLTYSRTFFKVSFFFVFLNSLLILHLPRRFKLLFDNPDPFACEPLFFTYGIFKKQGNIKVQACHHEVYACIVWNEHTQRKTACLYYMFRKRHGSFP